MRTDDITIDYRKQPTVGKYTYRPPECRFTTPWVRGNRGLFRVNVTIIRPVPKQAEGSFTLGDGEADRICQAISNLVEFLQEELR